jgi:alpha-galactosidase
MSVVNMDDCWQLSRDAQGTIQPDPKAFPNGIPALVDYVHSKKLKFGLYSGINKFYLFMYLSHSNCFSLHIR